MRVVVIGALALWLFSYNNAANVKFTNFVCQNYNESWLVIHECRLRAISRNKTILNFNATLLNPVNKIDFTGQFFKKESGYKPWLYKFNIDCCHFMEKAYNPIVIVLFKMIRDYSNINHTCPYMGPMFVKGFYAKYESFRVPVQSGEYMLDLDFRFYGKRQLSTKFYLFVDDGF